MKREKSICIIFIAVIVYIIYKERQALGCGNFLEGKDCNNAEGKAVKGSAPNPSDSINDLLKKINYGADYHSRFVQWRAFVLISIVSMIVLWAVIFKRIPSLWELMTGSIVLSVIFLFSTSFYRFHLYNHVRKNIEKCTEQIDKHISKQQG